MGGTRPLRTRGDGRIGGGGGRDLAREVGVGTTVEQQPHHVELAVLRCQMKPRGAALRDQAWIYL
jgi:hypothetical protein